MQVSKDYRPLPLQYLSRSPVRDQATIDYLSAQVSNPFYPLLPGTSLSGTTVSRSYLLSSATYPQFAAMTGATYDGTRRITHCRFGSSAALRKGSPSTYLISGPKCSRPISRLNGQPSDLEMVVSDQDRSHRFVTSVIWELPFGRGRKFLTGMPIVADTFLGGWQIEGIYTGQSGPPLSWGNVLFVGDIHDITLPRGERTPTRWFNTDAGFDLNSVQTARLQLPHLPVAAEQRSRRRHQPVGPVGHQGRAAA